MRASAVATLLLVVAMSLATNSAADPQQKHAIPAAAKPAPTPAMKPVADNPDSQLLPVFLTCPQGSEWASFGNSCYRYFEKKPQYWYEAELQCRSYDGHLVSINSRQENAFVGKLTYCRKAWTGAYALDVRKLRDPNNYVWTDGSSKLYNAHNFSAAEHRHKPLVSSENLQWFNHVYHDKQDVVCEVPARNISRTCDCPAGWRYLNSNCYFMPTFEATYIEGMHYCRGKDASLTSIYDNAELRAMPLLDDSYACPAESWIGLIKLNPCQNFAPGSNSSACYQWYDRRGEFNDIPQWLPQQPHASRAVNCVYLKDDRIGLAECYNRKRFICKKPAGSRP